MTTQAPERNAQVVALDDPRLSDALFEAIDRRIEDAIRRTATVEQYGTVAVADPVTRRCSVYLNGSSTASPGFGYGSLVLGVGSRVQVRRTPTGDRYVSMVLDLTGTAGDDPEALLPGSPNLVPNSSFEYSTDWVVGSATMPYTPVAPERARTGSKTARLVLAAAAATSLTSSAFIPIDRSQEYWASWWTFVRSISAGQLSLNVAEYDAGGVQLHVSRVLLTAAELGYTRHALHFGLDSSDGKIAWQPTTTQVKIGFSSALVVSTLTADIDDVQFERSHALTAYAPQPWELLDISVGTTKLADDSVTTPKLVANAVVAGKIATDAIETRHLAIGTAGSIAPVTNGDFEAGDLRGWEANATLGILPFAEANASVVGLSGMQGAWHATIYKDPASTYDFIQHNVLLPVRVGDVLRISALYASGTANAQCQVQVVCCDKDGVELSYPDGIVTVPGLAAVRKSVSVTIATAGTAFAKLRFFNLTNSSWLFVDDIAVARAGTFANADGTIVADETGLTIKNGKLTLQDEFGSTVMTASGFSGSWNDFISSGLLNGNFSADIDQSPVIGRTIYAPYWTLAVLAGAPVFETIPSGTLVCVLPSGASGKISSDVTPVQENGALQVTLSERNGATGTNSLTRVVKYEYFDWNKTSLGVGTLDTKTYTNTPSAWNTYSTNRVPVGGKYVKIHIEVTWLSAASGTPFYQVSSVVLQPSPYYVDTLKLHAFSSIATDGTLSVAGDSSLNAVFVGVPGTTNVRIRGTSAGLFFDRNSAAATSQFDTIASSGQAAIHRFYVAGDTNPRMELWADANWPMLRFGPGNASIDWLIRRNGAKEALIDDAAGGAASLNIVGTLKINGNQVVAGRRTGWSLPTGLGYRGAWDSGSVTHATLSQIVASILTDLYSTHGLLGA